MFIAGGRGNLLPVVGLTSILEIDVGCGVRAAVLTTLQPPAFGFIQH
jgi:hypothetical protein